MTVLDSTKPFNKYFEAISQIPHGSYNEKQISDYLVSFAKEHNFKVIQDDMWNVVIYKPASKGKENVPALILQAHIDMVAEKNNEVDFDFKKDPLQLYIEDGWLHAKGTTLGADDGFGVAYILSILDDDTISHPAIEATFTVQEEVGLCGAKNLKPEYYTAKYMINLDGGPEGNTCISSSGGMRCNAVTPLTKETNTLPTYEITIGGLKGGHSGGYINKRRGNANKLLARVLWNIYHSEKNAFHLVSFVGGLKENAIPREASATITTLIPQEKLQSLLEQYEQEFKQEYLTTDADVCLSVQPIAKAKTCCDTTSTLNCLRFLFATPNGLQQMSADITYLPILSLNLGVIQTEENEMTYMFSIRSPMETEKKTLFDQIAAIGELTNTTVTMNNNYNGWDYNPVSKLRDIMRQVNQELLGTELVERAGHGGLETGIFKGILPDLDIITMGPKAENAHTPEERLNLESFERTYNYLVKIVESIQD